MKYIHFSPEWKTDEKIYVDGPIRFSVRHLSQLVRNMCPISNLLIIGEILYFFISKWTYSNKYTLLNLNQLEFLVNIWNHGNLRGKNHCKNIGLVKHFIMIFMDSIYHIFFFYFKDYYVDFNCITGNPLLPRREKLIKT